MIYVVGHQSPDLDSVAAAISYAALKSKINSEEEEYFPAVAGKINKETKHVLDKFDLKEPEILKKISEERVILVDHNEFSQAVEGMEEAEIVEVLDHHKVNFKYDSPIVFRSYPWGASCTIIADEYDRQDVELDSNMAGLMLAAILVDTVITKSPTCTDKDKEVIDKLAGIAGIEDWQQFGMELFKVRSSVKESNATEIVRGDFKDFETSAGKVGIGQVETVDLSEFDPKQEDILKELENLRNVENYHTTVLFITDIMKEGSQFLVSTSDKNKVEEALGAQLENNSVYLDGIISRKKQVAPKFTSTFNA